MPSSSVEYILELNAEQSRNLRARFHDCGLFLTSRSIDKFRSMLSAEEIEKMLNSRQGDAELPTLTCPVTGCDNILSVHPGDALRHISDHFPGHGDRWFDCPYEECQHSCVQSHQAGRHIQTAHVNAFKQKKCRLCKTSTMFTDTVQYRSHLATVHSKTYNNARSQLRLHLLLTGAPPLPLGKVYTPQAPPIRPLPTVSRPRRLQSSRMVDRISNGVQETLSSVGTGSSSDVTRPSDYFLLGGMGAPSPAASPRPLSSYSTLPQPPTFNGRCILGGRIDAQRVRLPPVSRLIAESDRLEAARCLVHLSRVPAKRFSPY